MHLIFVHFINNQDGFVYKAKRIDICPNRMEKHSKNSENTSIVGNTHYVQPLITSEGAKRWILDTVS